MRKTKFKHQYYVVSLPDGSYIDLEDAANLCIHNVQNRRRTAGLFASYTVRQLSEDTFQVRVTTCVKP